MLVVREWALQMGKMPPLDEFLDLLRPELIEKISPNDAMYWGDKDHYFGVGVSALQCIRLAMLAADRDDIRTILDLPCGHGRVLRMLRAVFNNSEITACDLNRDGVDFCATTFGAIPVYSKESPDEVEIAGRFDLVWCGSLFTHLNCDRWPGFLKLFSSLLASGGIIIFTTHGRAAARRILQERFYGLDTDQVSEVVEEYHRAGFGYREYRGMAGYGVSLSGLPWVLSEVEKLPGVRIVTVQEQGWDNHQDVIACVRTAS
jgi:SAM-dependent methyltransferase